MKRILFLTCAGLIFFGSGCAHLFHINIDAINDGQTITDKTFVVVPGNPNTQATDLQFREFARYLGKALKPKGYTPAQEGQTPDIEIYLSYGLGSPQPRVRQYTVPVWGQIGTDIVTEERTVETHNGTHKVSEISVTPEYGVTGYATQEETYAVYPKYVEVDAYQVKNPQAGGKLTELWKTTIRSEGKRNDLRRIFPVFMAAASKYLGGNTGGEITVTLTRKQDEYKMIADPQE